MNESTTTLEMEMIAGPVELRAAEGVSPKIGGVGVPYNSPTIDVGGFREIFKPGAFTDYLADPAAEVRSYVNHDKSKLLGSRLAGTLRVWETDRGLEYEVDPPDTSYARDLVGLLKRGDVRQASIGFYVPKGGARSYRSGGGVVREVAKARLSEVSPMLGEAAYPEATASLRALEAAEAELAAEVAEAEHAPPADPVAASRLEIARNALAIARKKLYLAGVSSAGGSRL